MLLETYYAVYLASCAIAIAILGFIFHRSGAIFFNNAFAGNHTLARAVGRLLDMGFYMSSLGYVALFCAADYGMADYPTLAKSVAEKIGGLLLLMSLGHVINLLLLLHFGRRTVTRAGGL